MLSEQPECKIMLVGKKIIKQVVKYCQKDMLSRVICC